MRLAKSDEWDNRECQLNKNGTYLCVCECSVRGALCIFVVSVPQ